jgi:uncharacterized membrane protein YkoI
MSIQYRICLVLLAGMSLCPFPATAGDRGMKAERHFNMEKGLREKEYRGNISLEEAVKRVREETPGRVLSVQELDSEYRVRLLTPDGVVRRLRIDPATGDVLR